MSIDFIRVYNYTYVYKYMTQLYICHERDKTIVRETRRYVLVSYTCMYTKLICPCVYNVYKNLCVSSSRERTLYTRTYKYCTPCTHGRISMAYGVWQCIQYLYVRVYNVFTCETPICNARYPCAPSVRVYIHIHILYIYICIYIYIRT